MTEPAAISLSINGKPFTVEASELTPRDAREFRQATGIPLMQAFNPANLDLDIIVGLWWLSRRKSEPNLTFEQCEAEVTFDSFTVEREPQEANGKGEA